MSLVLLNLTLSCGKGFDKKSKPTTIRTQEAQEEDTFSLNQRYLTLVNEYRIDHKLKPLTYSSIIEKVAMEHAKGMATDSRGFNHRGFSLRCRKIKKRLGEHKLCGEIIAMGQKTPEAVLKAWLNSPKHMEELQQSRYNMTALAMYKSQAGVSYWTQIFVEL